MRKVIGLLAFFVIFISGCASQGVYLSPLQIEGQQFTRDAAAQRAYLRDHPEVEQEMLKLPLDWRKQTTAPKKQEPQRKEPTPTQLRSSSSSSNGTTYNVHIDKVVVVPKERAYNPPAPPRQVIVSEVIDCRPWGPYFIGGRRAMAWENYSPYPYSRGGYYPVCSPNSYNVTVFKSSRHGWGGLVGISGRLDGY